MRSRSLLAVRFVALDALDVAIDADQILIDLRELVFQRRSLAQKLQDVLAGGFQTALAFAKLSLRAIALFALQCQRALRLLRHPLDLYQPLGVLR